MVINNNLMQVLEMIIAIGSASASFIFTKGHINQNVLPKVEEVVNGVSKAMEQLDNTSNKVAPRSEISKILNITNAILKESDSLMIDLEHGDRVIAINSLITNILKANHIKLDSSHQVLINQRVKQALRKKQPAPITKPIIKPMG